VSEQVWTDWLQLRKSKNAVVTPTVLREAAAEAEKAGVSLQRFFELWCLRGSQGLEASWLRQSERSTSAPTTTASDRRAATIAGLTNPGGGTHAASSDSRTVDVDARVIVTH
jgi:hypothetical protein